MLVPLCVIEKRPNYAPSNILIYKFIHVPIPLRLVLTCFTMFYRVMDRIKIILKRPIALLSLSFSLPGSHARHARLDWEFASLKMHRCGEC